MSIHILEVRDESLAGAPWSERAAGPGQTRFETRWDAEEARQGLIAIGEGWTADNTRVRPFDAATD